MLAVKVKRNELVKDVLSSILNWNEYIREDEMEGNLIISGNEKTLAEEVVDEMMEKLSQGGEEGWRMKKC